MADRPFTSLRIRDQLLDEYPDVYTPEALAALEALEVGPGDEVVTQGSYPLSFAGNNTGISLKEALDAAHGHEHAEDGSELTPEQLAEREHDNEDAHDHPRGGGPSRILAIYAILVTLLLAILVGLHLCRTCSKEDSECPSPAPRRLKKR